MEGIGTYSNAIWREYNNKILKTMRTSVITDPPDGHIPPLTPAAEAIRRHRQQGIQSPAGADDLGLQDQCLVFETSVPPVPPFSYNSNYQIIQNGDVLMIEAEMIHDTRIIPLDGRAHPPSSVRLWLGRLGWALGRSHAGDRDSQLQRCRELLRWHVGMGPKPLCDGASQPARCEYDSVSLRGGRPNRIHQTLERGTDHVTRAGADLLVFLR